MKNIFVFFSLSIIIVLSIGTLDRNYAWLSEKTLWKDAMLKAPKSARPVHNLAWGYYSKIGDFDSAIELYKKALLLDDPNKHHTAITHSNIAEIYFKKEKFDDAVQHWKESIRLSKKYWKPYYGICKTLIIQGQWQKALDWVNHSLANDIVSADLLLSKGLIHLQLNQPEKAISSFKTLLNHDNLSYSARVGLGLSFLMLKKHAASKISFNLARIESPLDIKPLLGLIAAEDQLGNTETANQFTDTLLNIYDDQKILQILDQLFGDITAFPFPEKELTLRIKERLRERASRQLVSLE
jgi:tetratricopeptide (TPR) repeat protein